jgi:hypothetical protein
MNTLRGATRVFATIDDAGFYSGPYDPMDFDAFGKNIRQLLDSPTTYESLAFGDIPVKLKPDHDFWKVEIVSGRDWKMEKKLRALGISQRFLHDDIRTGRPRRVMRVANKRKRQARARTGRK